MTPLLPWLLALVSGLLTASFPLAESQFPVFLAAASLTGSLWLVSKSRRKRAMRWVGVLTWFGLGVFLQLQAESPPAQTHVWHHLQSLKRAEVEGVVVQPPEQSPGRTRYRIQLERIRYGDQWQVVRGTARLSFYGEGAAWTWGDRLRFSRIRLKRPSNFRNPGRFDYERYLRYEGIDVTGGTSRLDSIRKIGEEVLPLWERLAFFLRDGFHNRLRSLPETPGALLNAMVLGGRDWISPQLEEAYVNTGLMHLLAVSGLHVGFVAGATYWAAYHFWFAVFWKWRRTWARAGWAKKAAALSALVPVLGYMMLVGTRISAVRAGILVLMFLLAVLVNRERHWFNALYLAALLILLWRQDALWQAGFQLSFLAVFTILWGLEWVVPQETDPLERLMDPPWYQRWAVPEARGKRFSERAVDLLCGSAFFSVCAILGTLPVLLYQFHQTSLVGWAMNLWAVPLASLVIPVTLLGLFLDTMLSGLGSLLLIPAVWLAQLFVWIPQAVNRLPGIVAYQASPPWPWLLVYGAVVLGIPWWWRRVKRNDFPKRQTAWFRRWMPLALCYCLVMTLLWVVWPGLGRWSTGRLHVWMLDVGQGEALFVEFPHGRTLVLDGGGYYRDALDVGTRVVGDFLWDRGIDHLDYLGATHSDQDHIDGVESLIERFEAKHYLDRADTVGDSRLSRLRVRAMVRGARPVLLTTARPLVIDDVTLQLIHPSPGYLMQSGQPFPGRIGNDRSSVIRLDYKNFSMLLTGDIQKKAEEWLVQSGAPLKAQVLKSPHHGSRTSSSAEFLNAVGARDVLISSGRNNVFRHPHPGVLARYQEHGLNIWRTDTMGALHLETDGEHYRIQEHARWSRY